jgi:hypothetical protein
MPRITRPVIAISVETGDRKEFDSVYACKMALGVNESGIIRALDSMGTCNGWRLFDTKENIQKRIERLQKVMEEI